MGQIKLYVLSVASIPRSLGASRSRFKLTAGGHDDEQVRVVVRRSTWPGLLDAMILNLL